MLFSRENAVYGDFINVPRSYMDVLNGAIELKRMYSENSKIQEKFGSLENFIAGKMANVNINPSVPKIDNSSVENGSDVNE